MHNKTKKEYISLAEFVVKKRESLGYTREDLASKSSLDIKTIQSIEEGMDLFLATTVRQKLAKGLKVENKEIKKYEVKTDFGLVKPSTSDEIREQILLNSSNPNFNIIFANTISNPNLCIVLPAPDSKYVLPAYE